MYDFALWLTTQLTCCDLQQENVSDTLNLLGSTNNNIRKKAQQNVATLKSISIKTLMHLFHAADWQSRESACVLAKTYSHYECFPFLKVEIDDVNPLVRAAASHTLISYRDWLPESDTKKFLYSKSWRVRSFGIELNYSFWNRDWSLLKSIAVDKSPLVRQTLVDTVDWRIDPKIGSDQRKNFVFLMIHDEDYGVRMKIIQNIDKYGLDPRLRQSILKQFILFDKSDLVRNEALKVLSPDLIL